MTIIDFLMWAVAIAVVAFVGSAVVAGVVEAIKKNKRG